MIAFALSAWPACLLGADSVPPAKLGLMQVRVFDTSTGEWNPVYLHSPDFFNGWNWPGSNDDLEILVPVIGKPDSKVAQPLLVTVTSRRFTNTGRRLTKVIQSRRFDGIWLRKNGVSYQAVLIRDAHCSGGLYVVAKLGTEEKKLTLGLDCGD